MASNLFNVIEGIKAKTKKLFLDNKEHPPIFFLDTPMGIGLMPCNFSNNQEKERQLDLIKEMISDGKIQAFIFIGEAWMKNVDTFADAREEYKKHGSLKYASNKEEVLMIQYQSFDKNIFLTAKINRDGDNVTLEEWKETNCENKTGLSGGRFDNLFERAKAASN